MSNQKRGRACTACASIKIKCQLGSDNSLEPPCGRCSRLGKECILSAPKRQKDRVAELEAQVAALTRKLQAQGIRDVAEEDTNTTSPAPSASGISGASNAKKRRLSLTPSFTPSPNSRSRASEIARIDELVGQETQQRLLDKYFNCMFPNFPLVPIGGDTSLGALRAERPILLQAIIYAAGSDVLPMEIQDDVAKLFLNNLGTARASKKDGDFLELLQAIEIACLWYRSLRHHKNFALYEMIQKASELAGDLGMPGPLSSPTVTFEGPLTGREDLDATDVWRNWLVCHLLSVNMSILTRKPRQWEEYTGQAIIYLEVSPYSLPTDRWLAHYFRIEHLCERIVHVMELNVPSLHLEISNSVTATKLQRCQNSIRDWRALVSRELRTPTITFLEHLTTVYSFEIVLHTSTNKHTFAAPYAPFCLSVTDFPAPAVTQDHITAVYELLSSLHAVIDAFCNIDIAVLAAQCASIFAARVSYAHYLLAKLYIACTAPGNTFGSVIDVSLLRVDEYADKLVNKSDQLALFAAEGSPARILGAAALIKEFYVTYTASLIADIDAAPQNLPFQVPSGVFDNDLISHNGNQAFTAGQHIDWNVFCRLSEGAADLGLDLLFTEPQAFDPC